MARDIAQVAVIALGDFLAAPPRGTPPEVLEAFNLFAGPGAGPLPPRLFFAAVEQAPVAVSITDAKANILYVNRNSSGLPASSRKFRLNTRCESR